jgi:hypothetical protein
MVVWVKGRGGQWIGSSRMEVCECDSEVHRSECMHAEEVLPLAHMQAWLLVPNAKQALRCR